MFFFEVVTNMQSYTGKASRFGQVDNTIEAKLKAFLFLFFLIIFCCILESVVNIS